MHGYPNETKPKLYITTNGGITRSDRKRIQKRDNDAFAEKYELGAIVMDSTHRGMEIKYATRRVDDQTVVVKLRDKQKSFKFKCEEKVWRYSTELMLNLPHHKSIASIIEVLEDEKKLHIVTENAPGMDLIEWLRAGKSFDEKGTREILYELLHAVAHLHEHHLIHKDVKLENVVVEASSTSPENSEFWSMKSVKLIDFDTVTEWEPSSPVATDVLGSDQYIAPEAYRGQYSPLSDVFALGVIGYRLLVGKFPFDREIFDDAPGENWVGCPKMQEISDKLKRYKVNFDLPIFQEHPLAEDLLRRMLQCNETARPTAQQALEHAWMEPCQWESMAELEMMEFTSDGGISVGKLPTSASMVSMASVASTEADLEWDLRLSSGEETSSSASSKTGLVLWEL